MNKSLFHIFFLSSISYAETALESQKVNRLSPEFLASGRSLFPVTLTSKLTSLIRSGIVKTEEIYDEAEHRKNQLRKILKQKKSHKELLKERMERIKELREKINEIQYVLRKDKENESFEEMQSELTRLLENSQNFETEKSESIVGLCNSAISPGNIENSRYCSAGSFLKLHSIPLCDDGTRSSEEAIESSFEEQQLDTLNNFRRGFIGRVRTGEGNLIEITDKEQLALHWALSNFPVDTPEGDSIREQIGGVANKELSFRASRELMAVHGPDTFSGALGRMNMALHLKAEGAEKLLKNCLRHFEPGSSLHSALLIQLEQIARSNPQNLVKKNEYFAETAPDMGIKREIQEITELSRLKSGLKPIVNRWFIWKFKPNNWKFKTPGAIISAVVFYYFQSSSAK